MDKKNGRKIRAVTGFLVLVLIVVGSFVPANAASPKLSKKKATVTVGKTVKLKIKSTGSKVKWTSSNKKVATVKKSGRYGAVVKGKKAGTATITAKAGSKKLKCKVTVKKKGKSGVPYLSYEGHSYASGKTLSYQYINFPAEEEMYVVDKDWEGLDISTWRSSDPSVFSVKTQAKNGSFLLTMKKVGIATLSCTHRGKTYQWKIQITDPEAKYKAKREAIYKEVGITSDMKDQYKCFLVAKWMCENIKYDWDHYLGRASHSQWYGDVLDRGTAVCAGNANTYQYLLKGLNIESRYVASKAYNHAWNQVKINEQWYNVDVTWMGGTYISGDPHFDPSGNFLVSDAALGERSNDSTYKATSTRFDNVPPEEWLNGGWEKY